MIMSLHDVLVGGAITIIVLFGALLSLSGIASVLQAIFGKKDYADLVKASGAIKSGSDQYALTIDGIRFELGESYSSYRIKSVRSFFFVSTAFSGSGYLGIYDRRHEMYGAKCHPEVRELKSGDADFDRNSLIHGEGALYAPTLIASPSHRECLTQLRAAGFTEILFDDGKCVPSGAGTVMARMPKDDDAYAYREEQINVALVHRVAKLLRALGR